MLETSPRPEKATLTLTEAQDRKVVVALVRRVQMGALQRYDSAPSQRPRLANG